jgi:hypothetical protein
VVGATACSYIIKAACRRSALAAALYVPTLAAAADESPRLLPMAWAHAGHALTCCCMGRAPLLALAVLLAVGLVCSVRRKLSLGPFACALPCISAAAAMQEALLACRPSTRAIPKISTQSCVYSRSTALQIFEAFSVRVNYTNVVARVNCNHNYTSVGVCKTALSSGYIAPLSCQRVLSVVG